MQAKGEFEVKRIPQDELEIGEGATVGHSRFEKRFHGPLDATSVVHMLAVMSPVQGSGAYVAMERIVGRLDGRSGSFFAQHNGIMDRGKPSLELTVVPYTVTDGFVGLRVRIAIDIVQGHIAGIVNRGSADLGTRLHQVTRHLGLAIYRHMAADQGFKIHTVLFAVKHEFATIVRDAFGSQIFGHASALQAVYGHAFQHACADAAQHIIAVFAFQNDIINATFGQNLSQ